MKESVDKGAKCDHSDRGVTLADKKLCGACGESLDKQGEEGAVASDSDATQAKMCPGGCGRTHEECIATYDAYVQEALCNEELGT